MACVKLQVISQWCLALVMPAQTATWLITVVRPSLANTTRAQIVEGHFQSQAGTRLPHLKGHPGIELRKVLALLCVPRNETPCRLQVVDSSLFMQGLAQPLERLYLRRPHS